jgi:hypothetical protein
LLPGKPNGPQHYEFIELPSPEALQNYSKRLIVVFKQECRQAAEFLKNLLMGDWPILCGCEQAFLGPKDKTAIIAARQSLTAELLFEGPSSATRGGVGLPALIASRANPWCKHVSAEPMGIAVWLSADAKLAGRC